MVRSSSARNLRIIISTAIGVVMLSLPLHLIDLDGSGELPRLLRELEPQQDEAGRPLVPALILRRGGRLYLRSSFSDPLPRMVQLAAEVRILRAERLVASGRAKPEWLQESGPVRDWRVEMVLSHADPQATGQTVLSDGDQLELDLNFGERPVLHLAGTVDLSGQTLVDGRWWRPDEAPPGRTKPRSPSRPDDDTIEGLEDPRSAAIER